MPVGCDVATSQNRPVKSSLPVSSVLPSGLKATETTRWLCGRGGPKGSPVAASQICDRALTAHAGDEPSVGAEGDGLDGLGVLPPLAEGVQPAPPGGDVAPQGPLHRGIPGPAGAVHPACEPEQALADVALLAEVLAVGVLVMRRGLVELAALEPRPRSAPP